MQESPCALQTASDVQNTVKQLNQFELTKMEKLTLINLRPTNSAGLTCVIEEAEERLSEEQDTQIIDILSKLPFKEEEEDDDDEEEEEEMQFNDN